jgi:transposase
VLYDLTSVYFEGNGPQGLGAYGYSRDHREDRPQILLAVATDTPGGCPSTWRCCAENRADTTTLHGLLASLKQPFGIQFRRALQPSVLGAFLQFRDAATVIPEQNV